MLVTATIWWLIWFRSPCIIFSSKNCCSLTRLHQLIRITEFDGEVGKALFPEHLNKILLVRLLLILCFFHTERIIATVMREENLHLFYNDQAMCSDNNVTNWCRKRNRSIMSILLLLSFRPKLLLVVVVVVIVFSSKVYFEV